MTDESDNDEDDNDDDNSDNDDNVVTSTYIIFLIASLWQINKI